MHSLKKAPSPYKILISACLLGENVRYDAKINKIENKLLDNWLQHGILLSICPEVCGGLATPRPAAEIQNDGSIKTQAGQDVSEAFTAGALKTLQLALENNIKAAVLTEKSPSCGSSQIYNGSFDRTLISGQGVTTQLLRRHGIQVFNQFQLQQVQDYLDGL
ncbi:DUF523 domain-containing protein [Psychromonas ossibalaenae]|uniref:DUF523 domain-containing protein n=1 Tax=Psychromonas ossibalaenae TaxID=444922 RepID=UPI00035C9A95|nr:DUF523 domain-containing protein [Psychromonas ossibalaenae]